MATDAPQIIGKKIIVTGGAGFIGSALASKLAEQNQVIALDNLSSGNWSRCSAKVQKYEIDLLTVPQSDLNEVFTGVDLVFHLAAVKLNSPNTTSIDIFKSNVDVSLKVFQAASMNRAKKILFTSSLYAYGYQGPEIMYENQPTFARTFYGISKLVGENMYQVGSKESGMEFVNARLFFVYGPGQYAEGGYKSVIIKTFELKSKLMPAEIYGSGQQVLDYVYIDDCVESLIELMKSRYQGTVNVSTGVGISILSLIEKINSRFGNSDITFLPPDSTEGTLRVGSPEKLRDIIGWAPSTTIDVGLTNIWERWND